MYPLPPPPPRHPSSRLPSSDSPPAVPVPPPTRAAPPPPPPEPASDDEDEDEALEYLANQIAAETEPDDPWATSVGAYTSSLRRRLTTRVGGRAVPEDVDDTSSVRSVRTLAGDDGEEARLRKAVEVLEDEEVAGFLARVGKQVQEVRIAVPRSEIPMPEISSFRTVDGGTDWVAFCKAYLATAVTIHTPPSLLVPPRPTRLHISTTRSYLERLYIIIPPRIWERILRADIGAVWRWESPSTPYWCFAYIILWYYDLIPILVPGVLLYHIVHARLFPPTASEILAQATDRVRRSAEAAELSTQLNSTSRLGFVAQGARGLYHNIRGERPSSSQGSALARGLEGSAMLGGMMAVSAGVSNASKPVIPRTSALARAIAGTSGVAGGIAAPSRVSIDELRPSPATPSLEPESEDVLSVDGKSKATSLYGTATEVARVFGPPLEEYLGQASDYAEKIKNLLVHPDHPAVEPVALRLAGICIFLLLCPSWLFYKGAWAYLGLEFFGLWRFRELHPEWRRALMPWWWIMLGAPTDAEFATYVLQTRSRANKPLRGLKTLKRMAKERARGHSVSESVSSVRSARENVQPPPLNTALGTSALAAFGLGMGGLSSRTSTLVEPSGDVIGTYFALLHAVPGNLVISTKLVKFSPTRGFRTLGLKRFTKRFGGGGEESSNGDSTYSFGDVREEEVGMMEVRPEDLVGVKKEKRLGFEGIQFSARDGKSWRLTNVARRDDAFNKLVAICPSAWSQT